MKTHIFPEKLNHFQICITGPRKLPNAAHLNGRVVCLDIAFAHSKPVQSYPSITHKLIDQLGDRLAAYIDHHDSDYHRDFEMDSRFLLTTKAEHGACPELITPEIVRKAGAVDCIICHGDFDGIASAAKWILGGIEPYPNCDHDAWCIDTRLEDPSDYATRIDRALRGSRFSPEICWTVLNELVSPGEIEARQLIDDAGSHAKQLDDAATLISQHYFSLSDHIVFVDATDQPEYDRTTLLLIGQRQAQIAVVRDGNSVTFAAPFNSGVNFIKRFSLSGGMPTVASLPIRRLKGALKSLGVDDLNVERLRVKLGLEW